MRCKFLIAKYNEELFQFPADTHTDAMTSTPYMDAGVGIDNIFKVLRIDYVWRLTYRHVEDLKRGRVRVAIHFTF